MVENLTTNFQLTKPRIEGEQNQKDFISLFGAILRMRNLLQLFDAFTGHELLSERDLQDYLGRYQDLKDEWTEKRKSGEIVDIDDDVIFETELIKQIDINIDHILLLVAKYHTSHTEDKEVLISIHKAIEASPELRSKCGLIETFIAGVEDPEDILSEWREFIAKQKEEDLNWIIKDENLKPEETRKLMEISLQFGELKSSGIDIDNIMPPMSRFGGGNRAEKKQRVIDKLKGYFEKFFGIG